MTDDIHKYTSLPEPTPITEQKWPEGTTPLVSTSTLTYNHQPFIRDCLDGILMQKTTFPVRVVVFDDCSTDGTREIVQEYKEKYPSLIVAVLPAENTWNKPEERKEAMKPRNEARNEGKYIALCEGDDYWTDPLKLQKQVDFMEANEEYGLICGKANKYFQERNEFDGFFGVPEAENYETAILAFNDVVTASTLIRKDKLLECQNDCQDLMQKNLFIDTTMWYWFAYNSKIKFVDEISVVYRVLEESASHTKDPERRLELDLKFMYIKQHFLLKYPPKKREHLTTIVDTIHKEYETIVKFAQYVESVKMRQTKSFRLGNKIKKIISIFVPNSK